MGLKKNKILYVFCFENYSGAEIVTERLITHNNTNVEAFVMCPEGDFASRLVEKGIFVTTQNSLKPLKAGENSGKTFWLVLMLLYTMFRVNCKLVYTIVYHRIGIIQTTNMYASIYCLPSLFIAKLFFWNKRFIWTNHDLTYFSGAMGDKLALICHKFYKLNIAVSKAVKNKFALYKHKTKVLYNGLDPDIFKLNQIQREQFRAKYNILPGQICLGILGGIVEHKGHLLLLESLGKLKTLNSNIRLFIVGKFAKNNDSYKKAIQDLIFTLPTGTVDIISHTDSITEIYSGLDIVINSTLPYISEPLGTTIYEAMAFEKVVLASDTGGSPEIITDKVDGYLFEAGNSNDLANKLTFVLDNFDSLDVLRSKARQKVIDLFSINLMVANYNHIIENYVK